ncbi:alpha/beta fold hydrolase [Streptosporangium lutulentum]|uniref:Pimeloyl-ACP methyl ester carboxylesterase n=1 Tax=Streptosporangium lutulentum TaxID=1461250 RepID=A0ABT9QQ70_9ACTN|nr:alpha/beta hydrolase [Streptosporangium lutulentum]MDP9848526.1 pimeloyl-ACP methyl ester carboxylesterase [Streptosporangium lutulentum]
MPRTSMVDGFQLGYDVTGDGPPAVLLHGWPGDRTDYRHVVPLLAPTRQVVVPDLRGFGESDKHLADPREQYGAAGQARSVIGLIEELRLDRPVLGGYDVGSRVAQRVASERPDLICGLALSPPLPGVAERVFGERAQREFWYQAFHQLTLVEQLIDGRPEAVRDYLLYFWSHWSGPDFEPGIDHLVRGYAEPGAFSASISWYRAGAGTVAASAAERQPDPEHRIATPTVVVWPEHDPLFPREWSDRLPAFFRDVELRPVDGVGHFTPLECPEAFADAVMSLQEGPDKRSPRLPPG